MDANRKIRRCCAAIFCISGIISALAIAACIWLSCKTYEKIQISRAEITSVNAKISLLSAKIGFFDEIKGMVLAEEAAYDGTKSSVYPEALEYERLTLEKCGMFGSWSIEAVRGARTEFFRITEWSKIIFSERPISRPMYVRIKAPDGVSFRAEPTLLEMDAVYFWERGQI